ncbi:monosaccharide ABC transporter ATP-binding protein (CUT2 family) [Kribbella voronezhensis]|uniref:Monosaccharide ABC transporter ATP-binding protein (CUT2 family) n=1 Tax=Kribbella voronezhensis TaxID=2512212 RepID=A0A4R7TD63_9ACTN|nr:sugar ABC transporter ATP-binding protein [Kribbella voronezhensis]TDU90070.1 monosaccharide ABC transporter ATP-binding protein (CUT2 family) [Kribbella voronezhensis]
MTLFLADKVDKLFPGVRALDGVTLKLEAGSVHALLGENGAGKSTLIKVITGLYKPDGGRLVLDGSEVQFGSPHESASAGIGVVHQERNLIPGFTVGENILLQKLPTSRGLVDRSAIRTEAARWLAELDLDLDPDQPVTELSVAQAQLVEIAKALSVESRVLLLDEPTASITPNEAERLFRVVAKLKNDGRAVLFVSHKLEEVFQICDTVTVLRDGASVLESGPLGDLTRDQVVDLMVGRVHEALALPARTVPAADPLLELSGVGTASGHADVDLSVRPGEIVGLYGLVGAGRSELAKALLGLDRITAGEVRVRGQAVRIRNVRDALRNHKIGYVTENRKEEGVFLEQSVSRNIAVTVWDRLRKVLGYVPAKAEAAMVAEYVEQLGIRIASPAQLTGTLSGGNQQKVSLAKWLAAKTEILIIDEPTVGIDVRTKDAFHTLIWDLAANGLAILLITSDLPEMITLADRVVVMRDHRVQGEVANDHDYDTMSQRVIRLIHAEGTTAA